MENDLVDSRYRPYITLSNRLSLSYQKNDNLPKAKSKAPIEINSTAAEYTHRSLNSLTEESHQLAPGQYHQTGRATNPRSRSVAPRQIADRFSAAHTKTMPKASIDF
jgi:hypothetical protein